MDKEALAKLRETYEAQARELAAAELKSRQQQERVLRDASK